MNQLLSHKSKHFFFVLIKVCIVVGAFYFIFDKLTNNSELRISTFNTFLVQNHVFSIDNAIYLISLTIINWTFEIVKWKQLVSVLKKTTFKDALEQSLGSLTASLFTPNRIGEYGAKAMYYTSDLRKRIVLINLLGNMAQMLVTTVFGVIGLCLFIAKYNTNISVSKPIFLIAIGLTTFTIIAFALKKSTFTIKGFSFEKIKTFIKSISKKKLAQIFLLAIFRYLVFSFQFYFLLHLFKIEIDYFNAMILISSMYLLASVVPAISLFDVVIKGGVAAYLFSFIGVDPLTILSITTLMWLLNFVFPSLLGSYYVLHFNFPKETV